MWLSDAVIVQVESTAVVTNEQSAKSKSTDTAEQEVEHAAIKLAGGEGEEGGEEEEEEEECAFCRFMKGGGCKDQFVAWEKCVAEAKETGDFVSKCADITEALQVCMNSTENKDYYQLFLDDQEEYVQEHTDKEKQSDEVKDAHATTGSTKQAEP
jgi:mitochondrial intermembrane space import and assembly protein 40